MIRIAYLLIFVLRGRSKQVTECLVVGREALCAFVQFLSNLLRVLIKFDALVSDDEVVQNFTRETILRGGRQLHVELNSIAVFICYTHAPTVIYVHSQYEERLRIER